MVDEVEYQLGFPWPTVGDPIPADQPGAGCSMQLTNPLFDNDLGGSWRSGLPTPAAVNKGPPAANIPPQVRQVKHSPKEPRSGEAVTITAKVTDPDGVKTVTLMYQLVNPGNYIARMDPQYGTTWTSVAMHDDGLGGDALLQDGLFTVQLPASLQIHRRLIRYKIFAMDDPGAAAFVPYSDDPQPNFAYFVYDGVPAWQRAVQPASPRLSSTPPR